MGCEAEQAPVMAIKRLGDDKVTQYMGGKGWDRFRRQWNRRGVRHDHG
jgi:hypothetical protein